MKQMFWLTTSHFENVEGDASDTNPGRRGRAFAAFLAERLRVAGEPVAEVIAEDWGWQIVLTRTPCPIWVGCSNEDGSRTRWGAFLEVEPSLVQRLLRRVDGDALWRTNWARVEAALRALPGATDFESEPLP